MADTNEWVLIEHPDMSTTKTNPPRVRRSSYEKVWKSKGFRLHTTAKAQKATTDKESDS